MNPKTATFKQAFLAEFPEDKQTKMNTFAFGNTTETANELGQLSKVSFLCAVWWD